MGKVVNIYHLLDGPHRAVVAARTTAAHQDRVVQNKCNKGNNNPVQLPCPAVVKLRTIQMTEILEDEIISNRYALFKRSVLKAIWLSEKSTDSNFILQYVPNFDKIFTSMAYYAILLDFFCFFFLS